MATAAKKPAAKKPATKKPAAKKAVAKMAAPAKKAAPAQTKKAAPAKKVVKAASPDKTQKEARVLYTFRLEPSLIDKLKAKAAATKVTHAAVARDAVESYFG